MALLTQLWPTGTGGSRALWLAAPGVPPRVVAGPYRVAARQVLVATSECGALSLSGAARGACFVSGSEVGMVGC
ncbi:MAG: hypothetical protein K8T25_15705 [Planctomycetia bacterium]|nr:hypothetical protein [Planctomycetia bacterium]